MYVWNSIIKNRVYKFCIHLFKITNLQTAMHLACLMMKNIEHATELARSHTIPCHDSEELVLGVFVIIIK